MLASIVILSVSVALFVYWFRYSCALILNTKTTLNYSLDVAKSYGLTFLAVQETLSVAPQTAMNAFHKSLSEDYAKLSALLEEPAGESQDSYEMECSMLMVNFRCLSFLLDTAGHLSSSLSRMAVREMAQIVEHHANIAGERLALSQVQQ
jgi:hypothetical protein